VPTYHHQGVDAIGAGLVPTAWAEDGTVEALEDPELPFFVAVQWHPEMGQDPALFEGLVTAARQRQQARV
jgi:putative glutamine amidotransferase